MPLWPHYNHLTKEILQVLAWICESLCFSIFAMCLFERLCKSQLIRSQVTALSNDGKCWIVLFFSLPDMDPFGSEIKNWGRISITQMFDFIRNWWHWVKINLFHHLVKFDVQGIFQIYFIGHNTSDNRLGLLFQWKIQFHSVPIVQRELYVLAFSHQLSRQMGRFSARSRRKVFIWDQFSCRQALVVHQNANIMFCNI